MKDNSILQVQRLETGYGKKQVLFGIELRVQQGEIVSIVGPNGAGKSTTLKAILGLLPVWKGKVLFDDKPVENKNPARNIARGLGLVPQGNRVFDELTVLENLEIGGYYLKKQDLNKSLDEVYSFFPVLKDRKKQIAGKLSGGEKQMLALGRALMTHPRLLLMDEPSLGLSPNLVSSVLTKIQDINKKFGTSILIVEQKVKEVLSISDRVYLLKLGKVIFQGEGRNSEHLKRIKELFL